MSKRQTPLTTVVQCCNVKTRSRKTGCKTVARLEIATRPSICSGTDAEALWIGASSYDNAR